LSEQGWEELDEAFDKLDELMQRWDNRLTLDNLDLAKRYLKNELGIHVHCALGSSRRLAGIR